VRADYAGRTDEENVEVFEFFNADWIDYNIFE
jgi:hypothetical protein